jgi:hypothetical protein
MHHVVLILLEIVKRADSKKTAGGKNTQDFSDNHRSFYMAQIKSLSLATVEPKLFFH